MLKETRANIVVLSTVSLDGADHPASLVVLIVVEPFGSAHASADGAENSHHKTRSASCGGAAKALQRAWQCGDDSPPRAHGWHACRFFFDYTRRLYHVGVAAW